MSEHQHGHTRPKSPQQLRTEALEALLTEKGLIATDAVDAAVEVFQNDVGPQNGARMVARAWVDPAYRERMLADGSAAAAEFG
jgi:nitrile hydratase